MRTRVLSSLAVVVAVITGLTACSMFGSNTVDPQTATQLSLANQRKAALKFVSSRHDVEQIGFTDEGSTVGNAGLDPTPRSVTVIYGNGTSEVLK